MTAEFKKPYYSDNQLDEAFSEWVKMYRWYYGEITAYWIRRQMKNIKQLSKAEKLSAIQEATDNYYRRIV